MDSPTPKITWLISAFDGSFDGPYPLFPGDLLIHFRTAWQGLGQPEICDLWQMNRGSRLWFADRTALVPPGFQLSRSEVAGGTCPTADGEEMHAPNCWRVRAGDRLVLIGERSHLQTGMCYMILEFPKSALVYWTLEDGLMPMPEEALSAGPSPDDARRLGWAKRAVAKITAIGPPRTMAADWRIDR